MGNKAKTKEVNGVRPSVVVYEVNRKNWKTPRIEHHYGYEDYDDIVDEKDLGNAVEFVVDKIMSSFDSYDNIVTDMPTELRIESLEIIYDYENGKAYFIGGCFNNEDRELFDKIVREKILEFINDEIRYFYKVRGASIENYGEFAMASDFVAPVLKGQFVVKVWDEDEWMVESVHDTYVEASDAELKSKYRDTLVEKCEW